MARSRKTFTLEPPAAAILHHVGNYSDYVNKLVLQHAADWTEALALLRRKDWQSEEILAACDALAGHGMSGAGRSGAWLAEELARRTDDADTFKQRKVTAVRRRTCLAQLAEDPELAHALATVVREYWLTNEDCQRAVRATKQRVTGA